MRIGRSVTAIVGSTVAALIGLFLAISPWLDGTQSGHASWSKATVTDFWSGIGVVVMGVATLMLYRASLTHQLVEEGILSRPTRVDEKPYQDETPSEAKTSVSDEDLLQYATSLVKEWADEEHLLPQEALVNADDQPISEEELVRVAEALLQEIHTEPSTGPVEAPSKDTSRSDHSEGDEPLALMSDAQLQQMAASLLQEIQQSRQDQWVPVGRGEGDHE